MLNIGGIMWAKPEMSAGYSEVRKIGNLLQIFVIGRWCLSLPFISQACFILQETIID